MWWSFRKKQKWDAWVRKIIKKLSLIFPRIDGHARKFPKMHLQKHIPANIEISKYLNQEKFNTCISKSGAVIDDEWGQIDGHVFGWKK